MKDEAFQGRINVIIEMVGGVADLSRLSHLSRGVIEKYRKGESDPSRMRLAALAEAAGVNLLWLATGQGPVRAGDQPAPGGDAEVASIPRVDARLAAGPGQLFAEGNVIGHVALDRAWLRDRLGPHNPDKLALVGVVGDSMMPTIHPGDELIVDTGITTFQDDAIYAVTWDSGLMVKRLVREADALLLVSDNPAIGSQRIPLSRADDLRILGRVRWIGRGV